MNLTPLDIRKQSFQRTFRGFDPDEVQAFLEMAAEEFERLTRESIELKEQQSTLRIELERFRKMEETLQEMLRTAQQTADEVRQNARKEAGLILKESEINANRAIENAWSQVGAIRAEIVDLKNQRDLFVAKIQALVAAQADYMENLQLSDPAVVDDVVEGRHNTE